MYKNDEKYNLIILIKNNNTHSNYYELLEPK